MMRRSRRRVIAELSRNEGNPEGIQSEMTFRWVGERECHAVWRKYAGTGVEAGKSELRPHRIPQTHKAGLLKA